MVQSTGPTKLPLAKEGNFLDDLVRGTTAGRENTQNILGTAVRSDMPVSRDSLNNLSRLGESAAAIAAGSIFQASLKRVDELDARMSMSAGVTLGGPASTPAPTATPSAAPTAKSAATAFPTPSPFNRG